jgi:hypothetical protein
VVRLIVPPWRKKKKALWVSEASLRRIKREQYEKALQQLADERNAQKLHN